MITDIIKSSLVPIYGYLLGNYSSAEMEQINKELENMIDFKSENYMAFAPSNSYEEIQSILSSFNEKEGKRKSNGVYYTSNDVVRFIY